MQVAKLPCKQHNIQQQVGVMQQGCNRFYTEAYSFSL